VAQQGEKWGHTPWGADLRGASNFIQTFKKRVFQQKFRPIAYFLEKSL